MPAKSCDNCFSGDPGGTSLVSHVRTWPLHARQRFFVDFICDDRSLTASGLCPLSRSEGSSAPGLSRVTRPGRWPWPRLGQPPRRAGPTGFSMLAYLSLTQIRRLQPRPETVDPRKPLDIPRGRAISSESSIRKQTLQLACHKPRMSIDIGPTTRPTCDDCGAAFGVASRGPSRFNLRPGKRVADQRYRPASSPQIANP
jgi:hypothetical protein